ncbi:Alanine dehydrogenase/PNT [Ascosphaera apis ARSEF 7405]|uniref:Saccharopine dehydrogenase [NAD(+), L-lysine-forming] n=1 Tax=Ascosphaera apis ARSEF 7405 TaxID=392613 RepID=A0A167VMS7_9EURO|nr:Alanine dehydrogenase/PNT [Ascosphaera apis ARSEF 7405]
MSGFPTLHLRAEEKIMEHRSALTPETTRKLVDAGYTINVERTPLEPIRKRIFPDAEFEAAGATLVPEGSWVNAPEDHIIVGLKELDETKDFPLKHAHVTFAHCYKNQGGWEKALGRWSRGGGLLYDLEFLQDDSGRRVAAFGYHAGFAGAALALKNWGWQLENPGKPLPGVDEYTGGKGYYGSETEMINQIRADVERGAKIAGRKPRILVIGALGRCGRGAVDACVRSGVEDILRWDMAETAKGGPFEEIVESDIFINCIYLNQKIPNFVDKQSLQSPKRKLSVVCDVSCDTTNPNNPIPIYNINTTFDKPTVPVEGVSNPPLSVISIDHLPSLLPAEASNAFSNDLLPSLLAIKDRNRNPVWSRAEKLYHEKVKTLPAQLQKKEV